MNTTNCLNEANLLLHYYGELPADGAQIRHLAECPRCAQHLAALAADLERLPSLDHQPDPAAATRMAARVGEQLHKRRSYRWPLLGGAAVAGLALFVTLLNGPPLAPEPLHTARLSPANGAQLDLNEALPEIDFLEDLDLLKQLDLLSQIEGV